MAQEELNLTAKKAFSSWKLMVVSLRSQMTECEDISYVSSPTYHLAFERMIGQTIRTNIELTKLLKLATTYKSKQARL